MPKVVPLRCLRRRRRGGTVGNRSVGLLVIGTCLKAGVQLGADADIRAVLFRSEIESFICISIETRRLRYDSHERGLPRSTDPELLTREHRMIAARRREAPTC